MATGSKSVGEERDSDSGSKEEMIGSILISAWEDGMGSGEDEEAMCSITCGGAKGLIKGGVEAMG